MTRVPIGDDLDERISLLQQRLRSVQGVEERQHWERAMDNCLLLSQQEDAVSYRFHKAWYESYKKKKPNNEAP